MSRRWAIINTCLEISKTIKIEVWEMILKSVEVLERSLVMRLWEIIQAILVWKEEVYETYKKYR